jgi:hypothetical protein
MENFDFIQFAFKPQVVRDRVSHGICINYDPWFFHGESIYVAHLIELPIVM